jgi:hypothetical protein
MTRWSLSIGATLLTLACQCPADTNSSLQLSMSGTTLTKGDSTAITAASLELTYSKLCPGMAQPRSLRLSSESLTLGLVDEAGESRLIKLTPERIATLAAALRKAKFDQLASAPGRPNQPCTITLHVTLDGDTKNVEESPSSAVNDPAAWKKVQNVIEAFAYGR